MGCEYVGLVTAAYLAHLGHRVVSVDKDEGKLAGLTAKDAGGFLSHCGYCSMDQLL